MLDSVDMLAVSFQLTRLMRGVTKVACKAQDIGFNFNSHASCEA